MRELLMTSDPGHPENTHIQHFSVPYQYPVYFSERVFQPNNPVFAEALSRVERGRRHRFVAFIDAGVASVWPELGQEIASYAASQPDRLELVAEPEVLAGGEMTKNDHATVERLQLCMAELGMDRHSNVVIIGGGAFLDMIGYVAGIVHRGLRVVRLPTTVLAQSDSGVGVKTAINAFGLKNFLGVFAPPFAVINDAAFLATLDVRDRRAGMAEAVKVALIRDGSFFAALEAQVEELAVFESGAMNRLVRRCAELHMHQIAYGGDPFETGSARPLDFGHWSAHKLEALTDYAVRHGEAVAIGVALDTRYSVLKGLLGEGNDDRVCRLLERLGQTLWHEALERRNDDGSLAVLAGLREFQEHLGGDLCITLLRGIGLGHEVNEMDGRLILESIAWLKRRAGQRS